MRAMLPHDKSRGRMQRVKMIQSIFYCIPIKIQEIARILTDY
jgi:hypothetical protein